MNVNIEVLLGLDVVIENLYVGSTEVHIHSKCGNSYWLGQDDIFFTNLFNPAQIADIRNEDNVIQGKITLAKSYYYGQESSEDEFDKDLLINSEIRLELGGKLIIILWQNVSYPKRMITLQKTHW